MAIPFGFCHCDCGEKTSLIPKTVKARGLVKGQPYRFLPGHHVRIGFNGRYKSDLLTAFEAQVDKTPGHGPWGDCWLWTGSVTTKGYGDLRAGTKRRIAHRFAYEQAFGEIPLGFMVCHRCDVRRCENQTHFFLGRAKNNSEDMVLKGRQAAGDRNGRRKLDSVAVATIKAVYAQGTSTQAAIANRFSVSPQTISRVVTGKNWRYA